MKKLKKISLAVILLATLAACNNKTNKKQDSEQTTVAETPKENTTTDWLGVYKGTLPCASCEEIQTTLILESDSSYELRSTYVTGELETFVEQGSYTWDEKTSEITLKGKDGELSPKYKVENGKLIQLNADGKINTGELADKYILKKVEISDIAGSYINGEKGKGFYNELTVTTSQDGVCVVKITSGEAKKGCTFEGKGTLKNNRILINLAEIDKKLTSQMVVEFIDNKASVYTFKPENTHDLMYFCGGGGSLFGEYVKQ